MGGGRFSIQYIFLNFFFKLKLVKHFESMGAYFSQFYYELLVLDCTASNHNFKGCKKFVTKTLIMAHLFIYDDQIVDAICIRAKTILSAGYVHSECMIYNQYF